MKHLMKRLIRPLWRMTAPVRRPLLHKFDRHMVQLLGPLAPPPPQPPAVPADLGPALNSVVRELARLQGQPAPPADLDLVLNSVVRELGRLQLQVEVLQQQIDEWQRSDRDRGRLESRLSVVAELG